MTLRQVVALPLGTDALLMMEDYGYLSQLPQLLQLPDVPEITNPSSVFAARAILAGHDLVILEGDASSTRQVYRDLTWLRHHASKLGVAFNQRIAEANRTLSDFKAFHRQELGNKLESPWALLQASIVLLAQVQATADVTCRHKKAFAALEKQIQQLVQVDD